MNRHSFLRRAIAGACAVVLLAGSVHAATVRPPELKNRQQVVDLLLQSNAGTLVRGGFSGVGEVMVEVSADGRTGQVHLARSTGNRLVDSSLTGLAARMSFVPAMEDGKPVRSWVTVPFIFGNGRIH